MLFKFTPTAQALIGQHRGVDCLVDWRQKLTEVLAEVIYPKEDFGPGTAQMLAGPGSLNYCTRANHCDLIDVQ